MNSLDYMEEEIKDRLITARTLEDTEAIVRCLNDLEDIGWKNVSVVTRYVGINGERLQYEIWLKGGVRIIAPGMTVAFRLIWLLRFRDMVIREHHRWVKHENEMSPEEYEWLHS